MSKIIAIDPGNKKCGLLLADMKSRNVIEAVISSTNNFSDLILFWNEHYLINKIIVGDGTNCRYIKNKLEQKEIYNLIFVNERGSTLKSRYRYWEIWPPNFFISWLPKEILFPP